MKMVEVGRRPLLLYFPKWRQSGTPDFPVFCRQREFEKTRGGHDQSVRRVAVETGRQPVHFRDDARSDRLDSSVSPSAGAKGSATKAPVPRRASHGLDSFSATTRATGLPRLEITRSSPVRWTSSSSCRHFALNSVALMVFT